MSDNRIALSSEPVILFPFGLVEKDEEIILYGAGNIGKMYIDQIQKTRFCKIKYIVDREAGYKYAGIDVKNPEVILDDSARIIIASTLYTEEIRKTLVRMGIDKCRILFKKIEINANHYEKKELSHAQAKYLRDLRDALTIKKVYERRLIRVGRENDGGYLMAEDFDGQIAYSFGICDDVSWDADMVRNGYDVYMYDHTIKTLPYENEHFHFFRKGIADSAYNSDKVDTLENLLISNNHQNTKHMILKMDVEGAEWGFIRMTSSEIFSKFDQIVMELHDMVGNCYDDGTIDCIKKLSQTHQCVHVHLNNYSKTIFYNSIPYADSVEVLFLNKECYKFSDSEKVVLPNEFDRPCNPNIPDVPLGIYYS